MARERDRGGNECHFNPSYFSMEKSTKTKDSKILSMRKVNDGYKRTINFNESKGRSISAS